MPESFSMSSTVTRGQQLPFLFNTTIMYLRQSNNYSFSMQVWIIELTANFYDS